MSTFPTTAIIGAGSSAIAVAKVPILDCITHGTVTPRPNIDRLGADWVQFASAVAGVNSNGGCSR
jgi:hypothetical protein